MLQQSLGMIPGMVFPDPGSGGISGSWWWGGFGSREREEFPDPSAGMIFGILGVRWLRILIQG